MKTLALLIDGDNAQLSSIKYVLRFCEAFGTLKEKRAYGDWEQPPLSSSTQGQSIAQLGIQLVQQKRVAKNATDFRLAMDVAVMLDKGKVDIYFIVSSDGHFTAVCEQINQKGAKVIGISGNGSASSELRKACDIFFDIEEIVQNQNNLPKNTGSTVKAPMTTEIVDKVSPKVSTVPTLKTPAMFKLLSKPSTTIAPVPKSKSVTKPKTEAQPKVEAKSKILSKSKAEAKPIIAPKPKTKVKIKAAPTPKIDLNQAALLEILIDVYKKAPPKEGWVNLAQLGDVRRQLKQKLGLGFANKPLLTWFKTFPHKFEVKNDRVRMKQ